MFLHKTHDYIIAVKSAILARKMHLKYGGKGEGRIRHFAPFSFPKATKLPVSVTFDAID